MKRTLGLALTTLTSVVAFAPAIALAATPRTFAELANLIVTFLDSAAGLLIVAGIVLYFYGISTTLYKTRTGEDTSRLRSLLLWGLIAIFLMVSIWGILTVLQNTLFSNSPYDPATGPSGASSNFSAPAFPGE